MFTYPDLMFLQATERRRELEADARDYRLLAAARRERRSARWRAARLLAGQRGATRPEAAAQTRPAGTLTACAASAGSAR